jgi:hypothetical protein
VTYGIQAAIDNSNILGVDGDPAGTSTGAGVATGIELRIPISVLGWDGVSPIKVCAFINGGGHDYLSNQVLGSIGGGCNLAEPRAVNFESIPGSQYFVVSNSGGSNCPADIDGNGTVDAADLSAVLGNWGGSGVGDLDGNGVVDAADLSTILGAWGACGA